MTDSGLDDIDDGLGDAEWKPDSRSLPQEDRLVMYDGASVAQLSEMFHMDSAKVRKLLRHIKPNGKRKGADIYQVKEAARYLVEPVIDEETFIRTITRTQDFPPYLQKEFWAAQKARQDYEIRNGDLWATEDVLSVFAEVFKKLRMGIQLLADAVEARTDLSREQRAVIVELSDGQCNELRRILIEGEYERVESTEREKVVPNAD